MSQHIFVYGTLLFPEVVRLVTNKEFLSLPALLTDFRRYQIYDDTGIKVYPAMAEEANAVVEGKILLDVDADSVALLDAFENETYERRLVQPMVDKKNS